MRPDTEKAGAAALGARIAAEARGWLGVPFVHAGRSRTGIDCIGLLIVVAHALGLMDYDFRNYARLVNPDVLRAGLEQFCDLAPPGPLLAGDVVVFRILGVAQHVGIVGQGGPEPMLIHTYDSAGRVSEHPLDAFWMRKIVAVYRWREEA